MPNPLLTAPPLAGRVVRLEPSDESHDAGLLDALAEDPSAFPWSVVPRNAAELQTQRAEFAQRGRALYTVVLIEGGRRVGQTAYYDAEFFSGRTGPDVVEIGYTWYAPSVRRTAVNSECKRLMLGHAFDVWGCQRVALRTDARNLASRNAMQRLGLVFEGVRRRHVPGSAGGLRDTAYYSLLAEEWPETRDRLDSMLSR